MEVAVLYFPMNWFVFKPASHSFTLLLQPYLFCDVADRPAASILASIPEIVSSNFDRWSFIISVYFVIILRTSPGMTVLSESLQDSFLPHLLHTTWPAPQCLQTDTACHTVAHNVTRATEPADRYCMPHYKMQKEKNTSKYKVENYLFVFFLN